MFADRIKFRGKELGSGKWRYGYFVIRGGTALIVEEATGYEYEVEMDTVSQWCPDTSCLKVDYGDIYCGDIVRFKRRHFDDGYSGIAIILDDCSIIEDGNGRWFHPQDTLEYDVIGNVWDNFYLLINERSQKWVKNHVLKRRKQND